MRCWFVKLVWAAHLAAVGAVLGAAGCYEAEVSLGGTDPATSPAPALPPDFAVVADIAPAPVRALDILFVIDNSDSMGAEQASLRENLAQSLVDVLDTGFGGRPDLHVGVVSTDVGADSRVVACDESGGDRGVLQVGAGSSRCEGLDGAFLRDVATGTGRDTNYLGPLDQALGCMIELGTSGCGFEQPLEAMRRALDGSNPENAGFLRPEAMLAVVLVSDEDDCSVFDSDMFDPEQTALDSALGPLSSFRCFDFGVTCDQADNREPGAKTGCEPQEGSPYMTDVQEYVNFLRGLKGEPGMVVVAGIFGDSGSVMVEQRTDRYGVTKPHLAPSCMSESGEATPGVRLGGFLDGFPGRHGEVSICSDGGASALAQVSSLIAGSAMGSRCLLGSLRDLEPRTRGLQLDCVVTEIRQAGTAAETRRRIPACEQVASGETCASIVPAPEMCGHTETGHAVEISSAPPDDGTGAGMGRLQVACAVP